MKKEIKFSARLDSEEFNRSIEQMQRKLKDMYASSDMARMQSNTADRLGSAGIGGLSRPAQDAYARATQQTRRDLDQSLQKEAQTQEKLGKLIEKRNQMLSTLKKSQEDVTKGSAEELRLKERIAKVEENSYRLRENYRARDQAINTTLDAKEKLRPAGLDAIRQGYASGGIRGAASAGMAEVRGLGLTGGLGMIAGVGAIAGQAAQIGGNIYAGYKGAPVTTASNYGYAMQNVLGRDASAAYNGRSGIEMAYMPEKLKAMSMANEAMKGKRVSNGISAFTSPFEGSLGAGLKGAAFGAAVGSAVPVIGTGIGAVVGGVGNIGLNAMNNLSSDPKSRALLGSYIPGKMGKTYGGEYEGMMAKDFANQYNESLEGLKNENPMKQLAAENYQSNYMRNLDFQRSTGMTNQQFHGAGGFRENAINAGFTDEMAMGASGQILGAGGSTRSSRDSVFALQAGRNFDQTNAAANMGTLSNSLGGSEQSKQAYIKMLAEGTRIGLDSSDYREESRKFMDAAAATVNKSGTSSQTDIERIVGQLGGFMADKTGKGVQSAQNAFQMYNENTSQTSGPRGVLRASAYMKDSNIGTMSAMDRAALSNIKGDQVSADHIVVKRLATKYGIKADDLVNSINTANASSNNLTEQGDQSSKRAKDLQTQINSITGNDQADVKRREDLKLQLEAAQGDYAVSALVDNPSLGASASDLRATVAGNTSLNPAQSMKDQQDIADKMNNKNTGRIEDTSVQGAAEGSRMVLDNFMKFKDQLVPAAESIKAFNDRLAQLIETSKGMNDTDRAKFYQALGGIYGVPQAQPTPKRPDK